MPSVGVLNQCVLLELFENPVHRGRGDVGRFTLDGGGDRFGRLVRVARDQYVDNGALGLRDAAPLLAKSGENFLSGECALRHGF